ncbi:phenylacetate--CoA ligase family protein [Nocardioides sambongensis]|uniref:hypothetical protein n=1 Tax=Nocardioides sambongensis TaxID=2589074 RepID=UPI0011266173|nr:hypothetical protein [Nocardioides sambongensis]
MSNVHARAFRATLFSRRQSEISRRAALYEGLLDRGRIEQYQLSAFNATWTTCLEEIPFYRSWAAKHALPPRIEVIADLASFPVLTKRDIVDNSEEIFRNGRITSAYSTGGTTGTPTRYPRGDRDFFSIYADVYTARGWWGIRPLDPYIHLWGHSHLFGGSRIAQIKRAAADRIVGATRLNAYDMSNEALERHFRTYQNATPAYLVGYTSALFRLARHIENNHPGSRLPSIRAVVATAETVSQADAETISRVFGAPLINEYGAAEVGDMAVSRESTWNMQVLWASCILHLTETDDIQVTTLNPRLFPLINYAVGDRAVGIDVERGNALRLSAVTGRSQDTITLRDSNGGVFTYRPYFQFTY